jgi:hypothetical protein
MTHESVKVKIMVMSRHESYQHRLNVMAQALYAVLALHTGPNSKCWRCREGFCETVQAIETALND